MWAVVWLDAVNPRPGPIFHTFYHLTVWKPTSDIISPLLESRNPRNRELWLWEQDCGLGHCHCWIQCAPAVILGEQHPTCSTIHTLKGRGAIRMVWLNLTVSPTCSTNVPHVCHDGANQMCRTSVMTVPAKCAARLSWRCQPNVPHVCHDGASQMCRTSVMTVTIILLLTFVLLTVIAKKGDFTLFFFTYLPSS